MQSFLKNRWKFLVATAALAVLLAFFLAFGPPKLMARTESPLFCASCHIMKTRYETWFSMGTHRSVRCVDCHLPHRNLPLYYMWKSIDGMKDVIIFYSGDIPEYIEVSNRGRNFLQSNCIRCHSERVEMIDKTRDCWDCHRFVQHQLAGTRLTN
ncbi:MAG: cytochrome c nitrite reductase small subunit [Desulfobacterales bacterium]|nr:cytochrome c nitrite reductase small subunit [Desulfobacterales bacterium]